MGITKQHTRANDLALRQPRRATPQTSRRGLPMPDYPWATPARTGMGCVEPPSADWKRHTEPPWYYPRDAGRTLATDVRGKIQEHWKGQRAPREGEEPPWFEEPKERLKRHELVSSLVQQPPACDLLENRDAA